MHHNVQVIGDDIYYRGEPVAMIGVMPNNSLREGFIDFLHTARPAFGDADESSPKLPATKPLTLDSVEQVCDALMLALVENKGKSGLVQFDNIKRRLESIRARAIEGAS